jgi:hypothetical protein
LKGHFKLTEPTEQKDIEQIIRDWFGKGIRPREFVGWECDLLVERVLAAVQALREQLSQVEKERDELKAMQKMSVRNGNTGPKSSGDGAPVAATSQRAESETVVKWLRQMQAEIRQEGHAGWGNTLDDVIRFVEARCADTASGEKNG